MVAADIHDSSTVDVCKLGKHSFVADATLLKRVAFMSTKIWTFKKYKKMMYINTYNFTL